MAKKTEPLNPDPEDASQGYAGEYEREQLRQAEEDYLRRLSQSININRAVTKQRKTATPSPSPTPSPRNHTTGSGVSSPPPVSAVYTGMTPKPVRHTPSPMAQEYEVVVEGANGRDNMGQSGGAPPSTHPGYRSYLTPQPVPSRPNTARPMAQSPVSQGPATQGPVAQGPVARPATSSPVPYRPTQAPQGSVPPPGYGSFTPPPVYSQPYPPSYPQAPQGAPQGPPGPQAPPRYPAPSSYPQGPQGYQQAPPYQPYPSQYPPPPYPSGGPPGGAPPQGYPQAPPQCAPPSYSQPYLGYPQGPPQGPPPPAPSPAPPPAAPAPAAGTFQPGTILRLEDGTIGIYKDPVKNKEYEIVYCLRPSGRVSPEGIALFAYSAQKLGVLPKDLLDRMQRTMRWDRDAIVFHLDSYESASLIPAPGGSGNETVTRDQTAPPIKPDRISTATSSAPPTPYPQIAASATQGPAQGAPQGAAAAQGPGNSLAKGARIRLSFGPGKSWDAIYWGRDDLDFVVAHRTHNTWALMHLDLSRFKDSMEAGEMLGAAEIAAIEQEIIQHAGK